MIRYYCDCCGKEIKTQGEKFPGNVHTVSIKCLREIENEYQVCFHCRRKVMNLMKGREQEKNEGGEKIG